MRVGLIADTHDRLPAIAEILRRFAAANVGMVLHAGDYCAPFALRPFAEVNMPFAGVYGRNDGDREGLRAEAVKCLGAELYESPHSVTVDGLRILVVHDIGEVSPRSVTDHAVVVHGCSHQHSVTRQEGGGPLVINPGEACGWLYGEPSAAILDLATQEVELIRLGKGWRG
jgi:uncharacterized protein